MRARVVRAIAVSVTVTVIAQRPATVGEWRHYGGDAASSRYSPLDQINLSMSASSRLRGDGRRPTTRSSKPIRWHGLAATKTRR